MQLVFDRTHTQYDVFDHEGHLAQKPSGGRGLYDLDVRLEEIDAGGHRW